MGSLAHELNEAYYSGDANQQQMVALFDEGFAKVRADGYRFAKDINKDEKMMQKYYKCMSDFYLTFQGVVPKVIREKEIYADINGNIFLGYIDQIHKENGDIVVTDDKTSSIYSGAKIEKEKIQLILYGIALSQMGIPVSSLKLRWHFLKYVTVTYLQKNGKYKEMKCSRHEWVAKIKTNLKIRLKDMGLEPDQVQEMIQLALDTNSLDLLPQEIQDAYERSSCYVYVDFNDEAIVDFKNEMTTLIKEIVQNEKIGEKAFQREKIQDSEEYWCSVLCGMNNHCKYYTQYLEDLNTFRQEEYKETNMYGDTQAQSLDDEIAALLEML